MVTTMVPLRAMHKCMNLTSIVYTVTSFSFNPLFLNAHWKRAMITVLNLR